MNDFYVGGERTPLEKESLASGGQATVYAISGQPRRVVKIYHDPPGEEQRRRLAGMIKMRPLLGRAVDDGQAPELAWPAALAEDADGTTVGYVMRRFAQPEHIPLAALFDRPTRTSLFRSELDWGFLLGVAWNLAYLTVRLHSEDIVVGDFSARNIVVDQAGFVTFLDCDSMSFQDPDGRTRYQSDMFTPHYSAPERFEGAPASRASDSFALSICVFQLLTGGTHPFAGYPKDLGSESISMRSRIADGTSYVTQPQRVVMPRGTVPPDVLPPPLFALAERAFGRKPSDPTARPTPAEWFEALEATRNGMASCAVRTHHTYGSHLDACPWCARVDRQEPDLFESTPVPLATAPPPAAHPKPTLAAPSAATPSFRVPVSRSSMAKRLSVSVLLLIALLTVALVLLHHH
ncbi:protein kinase [Streptomyces sp. GbtcB6]|uniref:protein kinase domain-containing protein n=1 Tax=Streptomyces sp. GbtcB6 TaxID=2824751 RepID=UPI001C3104E7|nr:protein kinase [Streptomyces sp. GbtcB6]